MSVREYGFLRGGATEMSLEGWTGVCYTDVEESLDNLHEYSCFFN